MHIGKSILEGFAILGFDRETIKKVSREKELEDIFLGTLFLNYIVVVVVYFIGLMIGGYSIQGREINMPVFFGFLMIYPFAYNLFVYLVYAFFGLMAEMLNSKNKVRPLVSVGFHTAIVYAVIMYVIAILATFNLAYSGLLLALFFLYFLYTMFLAISEVYNFSLGQTLIVLFTPFLFIGVALLLLEVVFPGIAVKGLSFFLV